MSSFAEITRFKATDYYKSGATNLVGPISLLGNVRGMRKSYSGYEKEDPSFVFLVNDWATKDDRNAFDKHPNYIPITKGCRTVFGPENFEPTVNYVEFEDAKGPLNAPITEFVTFTLKAGNEIAQLGSLVQKLHELLQAEIPGFRGDSWGLIMDKPNAYHGILGWDTVEAHWQAVSEGPLKETIDQVKGIADLWLVHAALKPLEF